MAQIQLNQKLKKNTTPMAGPNTRELEENLKNIIQEETNTKKKSARPNFFLCNDAYTKRKYNNHVVLAKRYNNKRIKARNFLKNIVYSPLNKNDHLNRAFVVNAYTFLTQNLNPFSLDKTFNSQNDKQMISMIWE